MSNSNNQDMANEDFLLAAQQLAGQAPIPPTDTTNTTKPSLLFSFKTALDVLKEVALVNQNHPGYIANTMRKIFDESMFSLEQWQALASASDKSRQWAAQQWAVHQ